MKLTDRIASCEMLTDEVLPRLMKFNPESLSAHMHCLWWLSEHSCHQQEVYSLVTKPLNKELPHNSIRRLALPS